MTSDSTVSNEPLPRPLTKLSIRDFVISGLAFGVGIGATVLATMTILYAVIDPVWASVGDFVFYVGFFLTVCAATVVLFRTAASGIYVRGTTVKFRKVFYTKTVNVTDIASIRLSSGIDTWPILTLTDGSEVSMPSVAARRVVVASNVSSLRGKLVKLRDLLVSYGVTDLTGL